MAFTTLIFIKLTHSLIHIRTHTHTHTHTHTPTQQKCMEIFSAEFHLHRSNNMGRTGKNSFTFLSIFWLSVIPFSQTHASSKAFLQTSRTGTREKPTTRLVAEARLQTNVYTKLSSAICLSNTWIYFLLN